MERKQFIDALFARAKEAGFEACEVYYSASESFNAEVFKGEVVGYNASDAMGLGFRGLYRGKMGYASTQVLDEDAVEMLVDSARSNAELIESEDVQFLHPGGDAYAQVQTWNPALREITPSAKLEMAKELERRTLEMDARVEQVEGCEIGSESMETAIVNTLGLDVSTRANVIMGYIAPVARDGENVSSDYRFFCTMEPGEIDLGATAREAVDRAVDGLTATSMPSGSYRALIAPEAVASLLRTFSGVFSAENAQKGMSLLKGREGERIAAPCVTIMDDPHMPGSIASTPFDGEGVATKVKRVVDRGTLTTLLHNLRTANKQGVATTGNASRGYASAVGIAPSNFYIEPSETSQDALLEQVGDGVMITDVTGLHAGANPLSGDFSLSAKGYRVLNGKKAHAVKQITVAGNFYQLLKDVEAVGGDLKFGMPGDSCFGSPSLLLGQLAVAGK